MKRTIGKPALLYGAIALFLAGVLALYMWQKNAATWVLDPPPPTVVSEAPDTLAPVAPSIVDAPVTYDLATAIDSLEAAIPRTYGDIEKRLPVPNNDRASVAFAVSRSPFRVSVQGLTVTISADVEYEGRVWYRPIVGPELSASCGTGGGPRPRVRATLASTGRLTPNWDLRTNTRLVSLEPFSDDPRDRCKLTILRIDVTDRVLEGTRVMLEQNLVKFDEAVARWPVRPRFVKIWEQLQRPIWLTDSVYLMINPSAAQLGVIRADDQTVTAPLRLTAAPRIVTGGRPRFGPLTTIPPLGMSDDVNRGAHVLVDASFTYPVSTALLRKALVGRRLEQSGHRVRIRDVKLTGVGGGRVSLRLTLGGDVRGRLYFTGTPGFDRINHQICVPDLEYDVGTAQVLVRGFEWLKGVDIRDFLRDRARLPDSAVVGKLKEIAERGINRTLTPGVELSGHISEAEGTVAYATKSEIRIRALANANLQLSISKPPKIPRPRP